jgi:PIN domain nuclease of toxin-antitoxin system
MSVESLLDGLQSQFVVRPITARAYAKTLQLPADYPKDPVYRIIFATALHPAIAGSAYGLADQALQTSPGKACGNRKPTAG